jgi:hypothetical protein
MLIVYGVHHNPAVAAVLLHEAIGLLVPLAGGTIAYIIIRRQLGPVPPVPTTDPADIRSVRQREPERLGRTTQAGLTSARARLAWGRTTM